MPDFLNWGKVLLSLRGDFWSHWWRRNSWQSWGFCVRGCWGSLWQFWSFWLKRKWIYLC
jgi:hypothetical protein